jgi:hypothetical protein
VKRPPGSGAPQSKVCTALFTTVPSHIIHQAPLPSHSKSKKYSQSIFDRFPFCLMLMPIRTRNPCSGSVSCSEFGLVRSPLSYMLSVWSCTRKTIPHVSSIISPRRVPAQKCVTHPALTPPRVTLTSLSFSAHPSSHSAQLQHGAASPRLVHSFSRQCRRSATITPHPRTPARG